MKRTRKGFTLVELLIVIVVIGILSAMMMISSTEAVTSAEASNIVSNLRNLKTAALSLYVDKLDDWEDATHTTAPTIADVKPYLNTGDSEGDFSKYSLCFTGDGSTYASKSWYIACQVSTGSSGTRVKAKLAGRSKSIGLVGASAATDGNTVTIAEGSGTNYKEAAYVCMQVR